jgi:phage/plasmid-like protein (TIGR03299 family)
MHNLNFNKDTQRYSFVSAIEVPWHHAGTVLDHVFTAREAIEFGGLDFTVEKQKLITERGLDVPDYFATVREDNSDVLGLVGKDYTIVQNRDVFSFFDCIVGAGNAYYETAGCLGKGGVLFITAKLPKQIVIGKDGEIDNYLVLCSSHDGSLAITAFFTPVRVVCQNTLNAAFSNNTNRVYIKHTQNVKERFVEAALIMGMHSQYLDKLEVAFRLLYDKKVSDQDMKSIITRAFLSKEEIKTLALTGNIELSTRKTNMVDGVVQYYHQATEIDSIRGTGFGVYNSVTGYFQNMKNFRNEEVKMKSIVLGGLSAQYSQKVFDRLMKF